jgi:hypothetical protein
MLKFYFTFENSVLISQFTECTKKGNKSYTEGKQYYLQEKRFIPIFFSFFFAGMYRGEDQVIL